MELVAVAELFETATCHMAKPGPLAVLAPGTTMLLPTKKDLLVLLPIAPMVKVKGLPAAGKVVVVVALPMDTVNPELDVTGESTETLLRMILLLALQPPPAPPVQEIVTRDRVEGALGTKTPVPV